MYSKRKFSPLWKYFRKLNHFTNGTNFQWPKSHQVPIFTEEDPTYDDLTEADNNSLASGSVNEILDGIADVQEFRDSVYLDHLGKLQFQQDFFSQEKWLYWTFRRPNNSWPNSWTFFKWRESFDH